MIGDIPFFGKQIERDRRHKSYHSKSVRIVRYKLQNEEISVRQESRCQTVPNDSFFNAEIANGPDSLKEE